MKKIFCSFLFVFVGGWPWVAEAEFYYYHQDHLGGSSVITDEDGEIVAEYEYYPYGEGFSETGELENFYKFTDQEEDSETGLYYYGARYYDPEVASFYSQDPAVYDERLFEMLSDPQMLNSYAYVRNNPVKYVDPSGESLVDDLKNTNSSERWLIVQHPIRAMFVEYAKNYAMYITELNFAKEDEDIVFANNIVDAFRHCVWAAETTQLIGEYWATVFLAAHEDKVDFIQAEYEMDMHNNHVGIRLASDSDFRDMTAEEIGNYAIENNLLQTSLDDESFDILPEEDNYY